MFGAKKSYFRRIFDLRHFYGPDDNLYHPTRESPGKRLKRAIPGKRENRGAFPNEPRPCVILFYDCSKTATKITKGPGLSKPPPSLSQSLVN